MQSLPLRPDAPVVPDAGLARLREQVRDAAAARRPLRVAGAGTKRFLGEAAATEARATDRLDCTQTAGIVEYAPTELVVTARAGTTLAELQATLAAERQYLAFEPPAFDGRASVGGMVAAGLSGPRRASAGALRDFVLGAVLLDGQGRILQFGGQVMKNVAGYDVSRLLAGSLGVLGVVAEVSLKVLPLPPAEATLRLETTAPQALRRFNEWAGQPLPISATCWVDGAAHVRLSGAATTVDGACAALGGERLAPAAAVALWEGLREQRHPFFDPARPLWRLSLPSTTAPLELGGPQLIEWGGALRWFQPDDDQHSPQALREAAAEVGGTASIHRLPPTFDGTYAGVSRMHPLSATSRRIHQRLKQAFDPAGILNPGRLYDWL